MANPFTGIITTAMRQLWKDAIDSLLEDNALTVPCRPVYEGGGETDIPSPGGITDPIGNKPPGIFLHGSPKFAPHGNDTQALSTSGTTIYLCVIWDSSDWIKTTAANTLINAPDMAVQTLSDQADFLILKRVNKLVIDTDIEATVRHTFYRASEPEPIGFGQHNHYLTMWSKRGS